MKDKKCKSMMVYLNENEANALDEMAQVCGMSKSEYMRHIFNKSMKEQPGIMYGGYVCALDEGMEVQGDGRTIFLRLDPEEATLLEQKSRERGVSPQAYLRKVIRTKNFVDIEVATGDLFEICDALNTSAASIRNFLSLTIKSKDWIRREDVEEIKNQLSELIKLIRSIYRKTERDREKVVRKVVRETKAQIEKMESDNTDV